MNQNLLNLSKAESQAKPDETVASSISLAIHEHRLAPGTNLGEDELGEIYGVSRTVIRAALQSLSHLELVEIRRNRGAYVAKPSIRMAREVFEARELREPRSARSAAERATPEDIDLLKRDIVEEHEAMEAGDQGRALYLSGQFHIEIARIADQATIAGFIEGLIARSSLVIALYWHRESALCESFAHHSLIDAIADHDGKRAEELMRSHLVDLHSALDLRDKSGVPRSLKEALKP